MIMNLEELKTRHPEVESDEAAAAIENVNERSVGDIFRHLR
jgi:hypothetical protein